MQTGMTRSGPGEASARTTFFFGVVLLLFLQTLTAWLESIYRVSLTRLTLGPEAGGLAFALAPLLVVIWPAGGRRKLLWGAMAVFLGARVMMPFAGARAGILIGGLGTGAFLVVLCLMLVRPYRFLQGDPGGALGLAALASIALRAWGATCDWTFLRSGWVVGWALVAVALVLFRNLMADVRGASECTTDGIGFGRALGPALGLFGNLSAVYLVLSSPGVVEGWLGFDNPGGWIVLLGALALTAVLRPGDLTSRGRRWGLVVWNLVFGGALIGGILALRIPFPPGLDSPAVVVDSGNPTAKLLLNLMFLLSPVVLVNVRIASESLARVRQTRILGLLVMLGMALLLALTLMSIFTNVWGYVGKFSAPLRNQFQLPYLLMTGVMTLAVFLCHRENPVQIPPGLRSPGLLFLTLALALIGAFGVWYWQPAAVPGISGRKQLKVLTYNLQQGSALNGDRNWEKQLALLKAIDADLIGLQESDTPRSSAGNVSAARFFGARLGYQVYYGPNTVSGSYGTAILSRVPFSNARSIFTFSNEDEVGTAMVELEIGGKRIAFFNAHPSGALPRKCQAEELVRQAARYERVIAVGDFNSSPGEVPYEIIQRHLKEAWSERFPDGIGRLHPELRPRAGTRRHGSSGTVASDGTITLPDRIDHIFFTPNFRVVEAFYLPAPDSQTDHPAHWAVLEWN